METLTFRISNILQIILAGNWDLIRQDKIHIL